VQNGRCEYSYVLGLLVHGKVVVVFGRKVFFVVMYEQLLIWQK